MKIKPSRILMASTAAAALFGGCADEKSSITLNGAGASFPAPVYQSWSHTYSESHPGTRVNYQSLGSGAGLNQLKADTVDFAGSDDPLTLEEQKAAGLTQFPMLTGGVVVIVNVPGVASDALRLDRATLAAIFLGKITNWSAPEIKKLNPEIQLPDLAITVVRRADASGTSFIFTDYLSKISPEWRDTVGSGSSVKWPTGIGGQKNPGVCNSVMKINGAIGYTEYTYAVEAKIATVQLENHDGAFVAPTPASFAASAAGADWENAPGFYMVLTDQPGAESWPITGVTYVLMRNDVDEKIAAELIKYFRWCFDAGQATARRLNYVPLPANVVSLIENRVFNR